jgi:hypothetical protein
VRFTPQFLCALHLELFTKPSFPWVFRLANPGSGSGAGAGIQYYQRLINTLGSGFHWSDDFLRNHQNSFFLGIVKPPGNGGRSIFPSYRMPG